MARLGASPATALQGTAFAGRGQLARAAGANSVLYVCLFLCLFVVWSLRVLTKLLFLKS